MKNVFLLFTASFLIGHFSLAQDAFNGFALYNLQNQNTAYLIDKDEEIAHTWNCDLPAGYAMAITDGGNLIRAAVNPGNQLNGAAIAGRIQELDANADVVWEFTYSDAEHVTHHDICLMPNGHVLLIAWEVKSAAEVIQAGFEGDQSRWPAHIIEVAQNGSGGEIVWQWHIWDHLIQDHDASKDNYGVVADHPELIDLNLSQGGGGPPGQNSGDWFHVNGIDYNEGLDQIVFSSRHLSEIFIIDHSTTTAEAATHAGGNSGMGGDILYRWGNPSNYDAPGSAVITDATHDPRWIKEGRPNAGYIQLINNSGNNGHTAIDAINPAVNGYNYDLTTGQAYGPTSYDWRHNCLDDADGQSASDRMSNGNTFVALSHEYMYEVDDQGNVVWQYAADPAKAFRYECDHPGIVALLGNDPCDLVGIAEIGQSSIALFPNPSSGVFHIKGIPANDGINTITIHDILGSEIYGVSGFGTIDLTKRDSGFYFVTIELISGERITKKICLNR